MLRKRLAIVSICLIAVFSVSGCIIKDADVKLVKLPAHSPNLNSYAERWVLSVKSECLSKLIFFGEASLWHAVQQYLVHYHGERHHQSKDNSILTPVQQEFKG